MASGIRVGVIGAGISGLSAAYYLSKLPSIGRVFLFEASSRCGGWLQTTRFDDGAVFEHGPHTARIGGVAGNTLLDLVADIGLSNDALGLYNLKRQVLFQGQLYEAKFGYRHFFTKHPLLGTSVIRLILRDRKIAKGSGEDESVDSFFRRRLGDTITDSLVGPFCSGVFASDPRELSMKACFPTLIATEQQFGSLSTRKALVNFTRTDRSAQLRVPAFDKSVLRGAAYRSKWDALGFKKGMSSLSDQLEKRLDATETVKVLKDSPVESVSFGADIDSPVTIRFGREKAQWDVDVDHIVAAVPAPALARLLQASDRTAELSAMLAQNTAADVAVVNLEFEGDILAARGFGYLIAPCEGLPTLGVIFDSAITPKQDRNGGMTTRLTVMLGGSWFHERLTSRTADGVVDDGFLRDLAVDSVRKHLKADNARLLRSDVRVQRSCIPKYSLGHVDRLNKVEALVKTHSLPLSLVGASYRGIGLADCVHSAIDQIQKDLLYRDEPIATRTEAIENIQTA